MSEPEAEPDYEPQQQPQVEAPQAVAEPSFEETLTQPPSAVDTGRVLGARSQVATPSKLAPLEQTVFIGKKPPPSAAPPIDIDPDELEIDDPDEEPMLPPQPTGPPIDQQIIDEARARAAQIMGEAQMQAKAMLEQTAVETQQAAQQAFQQAQEKGYREGLEAGQRAGYEQSVAEFVQRINQAKDMFVQLVRARRKVIADIEPQVARLSVKIAERILGEELKSNHEMIVGIVRQSLSLMNDREEVNIRVHPDDAPFVEENRPNLERLVEGLKKFEISAEAAMDRGSVVIETNLGNIDARLNTQLDAIRAGIEETAKMRAEELAAQAESEPVEVPGDPEFEARQQAEAPPTQVEMSAEEMEAMEHTMMEEETPDA